VTLCKKVYVCVRVCVCDPAECKAGVLEPKHTLIHTLVYTRKHTHKHAYKHAHSDAHAHAHARTNTHIHTYMHTHTHTHTQGWRFRAPKAHMRPTEFWGIRRDALTDALPTEQMAAIEEVSASIL
jgi:hypothetical protein